MTQVIIFDLDGCLSDDRRRLPLLPPREHGGPHADWEAYHADLMNDPVLEPGKSLMNDLLLQMPAAEIAFVTARPDKYRARTLNWIYVHLDFKTGGGRGYVFNLHMRRNADFRSSVEVKADVVRDIRNKGRTIVAAYDDRKDVVEMYRRFGISANVINAEGVFGIDEEAMLTELRVAQPVSYEPPPRPRTPADILQEMADTFRERSAVYKDNYKKVGDVMAVLFPDGVIITTADDHNFYHLFELMIVKLTRFTNGNLRHKDSIHDLAIYAAMCEWLHDKHDIQFPKDPE